MTLVGSDDSSDGFGAPVAPTTDREVQKRIVTQVAAMIGVLRSPARTPIRVFDHEVPHFERIGKHCWRSESLASNNGTIPIAHLSNTLDGNVEKVLQWLGNGHQVDESREEEGQARLKEVADTIRELWSVAAGGPPSGDDSSPAATSEPWTADGPARDAIFDAKGRIAEGVRAEIIQEVEAEMLALGENLANVDTSPMGGET